MSEYFIGVDSGTQSTKAVVIGGNSGKILGSASSPHSFIEGLPPGAREQQPQGWVRALESAVKRALAAAKVRAASVKGIGISAQQHGLVPLDADGEVIRPAKLWCDTSTASLAESLEQRLGGRAPCIALTGNGLPAGYTASKIAWLKQHEPKNYQRMRWALLPHDYLNYYLTGSVVTEAGDASGTGLLNIKTRNWEPRAVAAVDPSLADKLPPVQSLSSEPAGRLKPAVAKRLGFGSDVLVAAGGGDNMMAAIGTGNTRIGVVTASLGTSGTIFAYSSRPVIDPLGEIAAFCDSTGGWLPLVCTMNVSGAVDLLRRAWRLNQDQLAAAAGKIAVGAEGLFLLPYFNGERTPDLPRGSGVFFGLNERNYTAAHMARATLEGVAFGLNYGLDRLKDLGIRPKQIRLTGGVSQNALWRQILADVFDAEVVCLATPEGAAYGAAIQAKWQHAVAGGERVRLQQITEAWVKIDRGTRAEPDKKNAKRYRSLQQFHNQLSRASREVFTAHAAWH
jgi:xylulokinase